MRSKKWDIVSLKCDPDYLGGIATWKRATLQRGNRFLELFLLYFQLDLLSLQIQQSTASFTMCLAKNDCKVHLLSCVTSFQITCNMKDGFWTDNRKRSMRWVSHKWFGRVRLFWEELQVRVEAVSYTKLGLGGRW